MTPDNPVSNHYRIAVHLFFRFYATRCLCDVIIIINDCFPINTVRQGIQTELQIFCQLYSRNK